MLRSVVLLATASTALGVIGSAAASGPTVAQIQAVIAKHSDDFVLANSYGDRRHAPGHGWIDVKTGAGRWVSGNGKLVTLVTVTPDPRDPAHLVVANTNINYTAHTWSRTKRQESANTARPRIVDPLTAASNGVKFRFLGVEKADGRQTYHLRSTYFGNERTDVWFSTDQDYLIRIATTNRDGHVVHRIDNHWLPRTPANLALLTTAIPSSFKQVTGSA